MNWLKTAYQEGEKIYCPDCHHIMYHVIKSIYPDSTGYEVTMNLRYPDGEKVHLNDPIFFCKSCGHYGFRKLKGFFFSAR